MSAKRPQSDHAKALAAFNSGRISAEEYRMCWRGDAWVTYSGVWMPDGIGWECRPFAAKPQKPGQMDQESGD